MIRRFGRKNIEAEVTVDPRLEQLNNEHAQVRQSVRSLEAQARVMLGRDYRGKHVDSG